MKPQPKWFPGMLIAICTMAMAFPNFPGTDLSVNFPADQGADLPGIGQTHVEPRVFTKKVHSVFAIHVKGNRFQISASAAAMVRTPQSTQDKGPLDHLPTVGEKGVEPPLILTRVAPDFAALSKDVPIAYIILEAAFRKDGTITDIRVLRGLNEDQDELLDALSKALRQWKFEPGRVNGEPADVRMYFKIDFGHRL